MGCDIHIYVETLDGDRWKYFADGQFIEGSSPFDWRSYSMYGFLAGVRNYSAIKPICEPKGFPENASEFVEREFEGWWGHSTSWLTLAELLAVDYESTVEDRRCTVEVYPGFFDGGATCEPGQGTKETIREFLGAAFFDDLETLKKIGKHEEVRIVFWFDN